MSNEKNIVKKHHTTFEELKHSDENGDEFWLARQLSKVLGYGEFRNFLPVIERAKASCENSGQEVSDHFVGIHEMIMLGQRGIKPEELPAEEDLKKLERRVASAEKKLIKRSALPKKGHDDDK